MIASSKRLRLLMEAGFDYEVIVLRKLRQTAHNFPPAVRHPDLSWATHHGIGSSKFLARHLAIYNEARLEFADHKADSATIRYWVERFVQEEAK